MSNYGLEITFYLQQYNLLRFECVSVIKKITCLAPKCCRIMVAAWTMLFVATNYGDSSHLNKLLNVIYDRLVSTNSCKMGKNILPPVKNN